MRKSIFDIVTKSINISNEVDRIFTMSLKEKILYNSYVYYTLFDFVDDFCFKKWEHRGHFVDVKDFVEALDYNNIRNDAKNGNIDAFMILIELTYNFWNLAYRNLMDKNTGTK